ncbi:MAG: ABC transporter ATP-binding protein [Fervidicoccaceae archaeon]
MSLLRIRDLTAYYFLGRKREKVLSDIELSIERRERIAVVGESGSGKTTLASIITRMEAENLEIASGEVLFEGRDLLKASESELREIRGKEISVVFQNPSSSLDPLYPVGEQIAEVFREHGYGKGEAKSEAVELLRSVGIPNPERSYFSYPHQLSGGQKQRVAIAIAIALRPKLLVADEPTSALDVSTQTQIIDLLNTLSREYGTSLLLITHDIGVAYDASDRMVVMYGGRIMEIGRTEKIVESPLHPYTSYLLSSVPIGKNVKRIWKRERRAFSQSSNGFSMEGCPFSPRCPLPSERCSLSAPPLKEIDGRSVYCWKAESEVILNAWGL